MRKALQFWIVWLLVALLLGASAQSVRRRAMFPSTVALDSISGLKLWLKADSLSLSDGDAISTWSDSSGNSNNATGVTTTRPVYKTNILNGYPSVRPDGSDDKMTLSDANAIFQGNTWTAFFVVKIGSNKSNNHLTGGTNGSTNQELRLGWSDTTHLFLGQYANDLTSSATSENASGEIYTFIRGASGREIKQSNTSRGTDSNADLMGSVTTFYLFRSDLTGATFQGDVMEIVIYSPSLGTTDEANAYNSLKAKYGL